jgi:hypothetical protein
MKGLRKTIITVMAIAFAGMITAKAQEQNIKTKVTLTGNGPDAVLKFDVNGKTVIDTTGTPFISKSDCEVRTDCEKIENGAVITVTVSNNSSSNKKLPCFNFPMDFSADAEYLYPKWGGVGFYQGKARRTHPSETYPGTMYSPIAGLAENNMILGVSLIYDLFKYQRVFGMRTFYLKNKWHFTFRPLDRQPALTEKELRGRKPVEGTLAPGEKRIYRFAICAVPRAKWVTAFKPYRDYFVSKYGKCRIKNPDKRPVAALSFGSRRYFAEDNKMGYYYRLDKLGWKPFVDNYLKEYAPKGWKRFMIWQVAGSYIIHQHRNMVFEIASAQTPKSLETIGELKRLTDAGIQIGFWLGRATEISKGFDTGERWPIDLDNPKDREIWKKEVSMAYGFGVRMIGLDGVRRGYGHAGISPDGWYVAQKFLPWIAKEFPDMTFVMEPGIVDFQHLHVPIFAWDMNIPGKPEWQNYLIPGQVTYGVIRPNRLAAGKNAEVKDQEKRFRQLKAWGYVPMVFMDPCQKPYWFTD